MPDIYQELRKIEDLGFSLGDIKRSELTIAFISLRSALLSWFSTYQSFRWQFHIADPNYEMPTREEVEVDPDKYAVFIRNYNHPQKYLGYYTETIFHFHHFFELLLKDILRGKHELLVSDSSRYPIILYKLLHGENISTEEQQKLFSVEFSETLNRLIELIREKKYDEKTYHFLIEGEPVLRKLNHLRNRLVHRGTFLLPYSALDEFVSKHVLPVIFKLIEFPEYKGNENLWKYKSLHCGIDPLDEILKEFKNKDLYFKRIAALKELGRAAYQSPIQRTKLIIDRGDRERAEVLANFEAKEKRHSNIYDVLSCPACGTNSLVRFYDIEPENPEPDNPGRVWLFTYNVQCFCCSFEITKDLQNMSELYLPIEDYWLEEELFPEEDNKLED